MFRNFIPCYYRLIQDPELLNISCLLSCLYIVVKKTSICQTLMTAWFYVDVIRPWLSCQPLMIWWCSHLPRQREVFCMSHFFTINLHTWLKCHIDFVAYVSHIAFSINMLLCVNTFLAIKRIFTLAVLWVKWVLVKTRGHHLSVWL